MLVFLVFANSCRIYEAIRNDCKTMEMAAMPTVKDATSSNSSIVYPGSVHLIAQGASKNQVRFVLHFGDM